MKHIIKLLISSLLTISCVFPTYAVTNSPFENDILIEEEISLCDEDVTIRMLTTEEAAVEVASAYKISYTNALEKVLVDLSKGIIYGDATITKNFGEAPDGTVYADWVVEVGAVFQVATGSGHSNFIGDPIRTWSIEKSSGVYQWDPAYDPIAEITGATSNSVYLQVRGNCYVQFDHTEDVGFDINIIPEVLGFTMSTSTTYPYYYRKTSTISGTYTMPGYNPYLL